MAVIITDPDSIIEGDDVTTNTTLRTQTINPGYTFPFVAAGSSTITRSTGQSISVTAPLERNYLNP